MYLAIDPMPHKIDLTLFENFSGKKKSFKVLYSGGMTEPELYGSPMMFRSLMNRMLSGRGERATTGSMTVLYRLVMGGNLPQPIFKLNPAALDSIEKFLPTSPLHLSVFLNTVRIFMKQLPNARHIAFSETGFFSALPADQKIYALPNGLGKKNNIIRSGFHGIFHGYAASLAKKEKFQKVLSICLDKKMTVCAIKNGKPVAISFGVTPLEGLMGETSSGDIDAGLIFYLMGKESLSASKMDDILKYKSGFYAMTKRKERLDTLFKVYSRNKSVRLAFDTLKHNLLVYLGRYFGILNGVDAIYVGGGYAVALQPFVFMLLKDLYPLGVNLREAEGSVQRNGSVLTSDQSKIKAVCCPESFSEIMVMMGAKDEL